MISVQKLRVEYKENPIGLDVRQPRVSWQLHSDERDVLQEAYQIQVAVEPEFHTVLWESGKVHSEQSAHIELQELKLQSLQRYYYRVKVWDPKGRIAEWSEAAYWEMGLLEAADWKAEWISAPLSCLDAEAEACPLLRRTFEIGPGLVRARAVVTSLGLYEIELNGSRVGGSYLTPGWTSYKHRLQVQTYDVTDLLQTGDNAVGAWLGNGWYKGNLAWENQKHILATAQRCCCKFIWCMRMGKRRLLRRTKIGRQLRDRF